MVFGQLYCLESELKKSNDLSGFGFEKDSFKVSKTIQIEIRRGIRSRIRAVNMQNGLRIRLMLLFIGKLCPRMNIPFHREVKIMRKISSTTILDVRGGPSEGTKCPLRE